jgi:hypothetical protein
VETGGDRWYIHIGKKSSQKDWSKKPLLDFGVLEGLFCMINFYYKLNNKNK